jgi:hypothetical protein
MKEASTAENIQHLKKIKDYKQLPGLPSRESTKPTVSDVLRERRQLCVDVRSASIPVVNSSGVANH